MHSPKLKPQHEALVRRILAGQQPIPAVMEVYEVPREAAAMRVGRLLRHRSVFYALQATPVKDSSHPRELVPGVWVAKAPHGRIPDIQPIPTGDTEAVRKRLAGLLYGDLTLDHDGWVSLAADIRTARFVAGSNHSGTSDYRVLAWALAEVEGEPRGEAVREPHPETLIPRDMMDQSDQDFEEFCRKSNEERPYIPSCPENERTPDGNAYRAYVDATNQRNLSRRPSICPLYWREWVKAGRPAFQ